MSDSNSVRRSRFIGGAGEMVAHPLPAGPMRDAAALSDAGRLDMDAYTRLRKLVAEHEPERLMTIDSLWRFTQDQRARRLEGG